MERLLWLVASTIDVTSLPDERTCLHGACQSRPNFGEKPEILELIAAGPVETTKSL
jgi:hypothetical protein